jgi:phospholipid-transporting ATPase
MVSGIKEIRKSMRQESDRLAESDKASFPYITEFFLNLALCNTVVCEKDKKTGDILYKASSPDELALANGAKISGIKLHRREHDRVFIHNLLTKEEFSYRVIAEFPFDSVRKRMSVILKGSNGEYQILCKGADSVMLDRIMYEKNGIDGLRDIIEHDLYTYSCEGLRTLMMGKRTICKEEYDTFIKIYDHL